MSRLDRSMDRVEFQAGLGMHGDESSFASSERDQRAGGGQATGARPAAAFADSAAHRLRELLAEGSRIREEDADGYVVAASVGRDSRPSQGSSVTAPPEGQVQPGASHAVLSALRSMRERLRASEAERHSLVDQLQAAHDRIRELEAELSRVREEGEGWRRAEEADHRKQLGQMHAELQSVRIQLLETSQDLTLHQGRVEEAGRAKQAAEAAATDTAQALAEMRAAAERMQGENEALRAALRDARLAREASDRRKAVAEGRDGTATLASMPDPADGADASMSVGSWSLMGGDDMSGSGSAESTTDRAGEGASAGGRLVAHRTVRPERSMVGVLRQLEGEMDALETQFAELVAGAEADVGLSHGDQQDAERLRDKAVRLASDIRAKGDQISALKAAVRGVRAARERSPHVDARATRGRVSALRSFEKVRAVAQGSDRGGARAAVAWAEDRAARGVAARSSRRASHGSGSGTGEDGPALVRRVTRGLNSAAATRDAGRQERPAGGAQQHSTARFSAEGAASLPLWMPVDDEDVRSAAQPREPLSPVDRPAAIVGGGPGRPAGGSFRPERR
ncbi:hypothetical protein FNF29_04139 [Cafeteria roenbergensis]|uniref:Uncharacterized protein n=1 Tax=Cafeteria roenbergensis TaxID=33653 RepID=A0A5A8CHQ5_CAFRO|nr:hypothetical protein FNF29_04139 [Cafeteria roenbergensis]|eukprot:KAA0152024.1 hypothetical protein FNF29_04139 [Cafeteria roenbergensis]